MRLLTLFLPHPSTRRVARVLLFIRLKMETNYRWGFGGRDTCESCKSIDVRRWHREGRWLAGHQFSWSWTSSGEPFGAINVSAESDAVVLMYQAHGFLAARSKCIERRVPIAWTPCHLGGRRPWFVCSVHTNGQYCGRRVAVLYAAGELFACRRCCALAYASQQRPAGS